MQLSSAITRCLLQNGISTGGFSLARLLSSLPAQHLPDAALELPPFHYQPPPYVGPTKEEVIAMRKQHLSPSLFTHFKKPVMIVDGKMQYLFDERGRRYLDVVYFVNSGSEANDLAIMLARAYTGNFDLMALRNCYHGMSLATMGVCGHSTWKQPQPQGFGVHHALNPDAYRGAFGNDGPRYAQDIQDLLLTATSGRVAAFMAETIQGVGGAVPLADGYLPAVYKMIREAGGLCIADEVQSGFGRTGSAYWGFENQGVIPDIVTMAKGIGNGLPLAAVVTTPEIANSIVNRLHFNTYGGNPVSSAAGRAVLRIVDREQRQHHCAEVGGHLKARLQELQVRHSIIGDVRGSGLMLGVELVKDRATKEPAKAETVEAMERMKDLGVLMGKGGLFGNVFRIKPPMCFSKADADYLVDVMDASLAGL